LKTRILSEELEEKLEQYVLEGKYEDGANPLAPSPSQQAESYNAASAASAQPNKKVEISDNIEQIPPAEASVAPDLSLDAKQSQLPMAAAAAPIKAKPKNNPSSRGSNDGVDKKIQKVINWVKKALATEDFQNLSKDLR
jgi:hypothetical protein